MSSSNGSKRKLSVEHRVNELLELFYPVHYKMGFEFEDAMRMGRLTRNQIAILWMIRAEGVESRRMRRKDIERSLRSWFEVSSAGITKAVRGMSRSSAALLKIIEDPDTAREKLVLLTPNGEKFLSEMIAQGRNSIRRLVAHFSEEEVDGGIRFLRKIAARSRYKPATSYIAREERILQAHDLPSRSESLLRAVLVSRSAKIGRGTKIIPNGA
jgi:DNA-binding MarR family transcriptional regulator